MHLPLLIDGDEFMYFLQHILVPHQPFDGVNPHSVVVMDNASIHNVDRAVQLIESTGVLVQFLPPYSPDLNPIEEAFSQHCKPMNNYWTSSTVNHLYCVHLLQLHKVTVDIG